MKFDAKEFQKATVKKAVAQLFDKRSSRRFLVADEVGLGKTIIAAHVINHLRATKRSARVVYITSNLDIANQNKGKLAADSEDSVVKSDRIILAVKELYSESSKKKGIKLLSFTPTTSIFIRRHLGAASEREFIALLGMKYCGFTLDWACKVFSQLKSDESIKAFRLNLRKAYKKRLKIPEELRREVRECILNVSVKTDDGSERLLKLINRSITENSSKEVVKEVRQALSRIFLKTLKADLVIVDEFQRCGDLISWSEEAGLRREVEPLMGKSSVLLLSATPYTLAPSNSLKLSTHEGARHYQDLDKVLKFLSMNVSETNSILRSLGEYGKSISSFSKENTQTVFNIKSALEKKLGRYISRTERITYEAEEHKPDVLFLSKWSADNELSYNSSQIANFFGMREAVKHPSVFLQYWKSGDFPLTYMEDYAVIKKCKHSKIVNRELCHSSLTKEVGAEHLKLRYLYRNLLKDGACFNHLWVKPSRLYYESEKVFSGDFKDGPSKALVFSVWQFVPRFVSNEIALLRTSGSSSKKRHVQIKPTTFNWFRFYFPSGLLSSLLSHRDFVKAKSLNGLKSIAASKLHLSLKSMGVDTSFKNKATGLKAWELIRLIEVENANYKDLLFSRYGRSHSRYSSHLKKEQIFSSKELRVLRELPVPRHINKKSFDMLVDVAIGSPSVCLRRSLESLKGDLSDDEILELASFCINVPRSFINRRGTHDAIASVYGKRTSIALRTLRYFIDGNIQSVLDEYLYMNTASDISDQKWLARCLDRLRLVWGPIKNRSRIKVRGKAGKISVTNDVAISFAGGNVESESRDNIRASFNSPFWPFVLSTTSIGQEGLDFHLYCKDIVHWDLPSSPVAFEQREGRINRFNNLNVRRNIVEAVPDDGFEGDGMVWKYLFENAKFFSSRMERYSNGLSPNWVFTSDKIDISKIQRHILDLPLSKDSLRYEKLITDVIHYRLALGQPNQVEFLKSIRENQNLRESGLSRSLTINLAPSQKDLNEQLTNEIVADSRLREIFLKDVIGYLNSNKSHVRFSELKERVMKQFNLVVKSNAPSRKAISALLYFLVAVDSVHDGVPDVGFDDDIEMLKKAG